MTSQPAPAVPVIQVRGATKTYPGGYEALRGVDFDVSAGEMVFLTGPSGAGKSTLLKLICALERPSAGRIVVHGEDLSRLSARAIPYFRRNLGIVFQDQRLLFDRSALDNVMLPLRIAGLATADAARRARAALDRVGLRAREGTFPVALSGGEQQRLCVARAVVARPSIVVADEPTVNLDAAYALDIMRLLADFNQVGVTVLVASHDQALVDRFASRQVHITGGRLDA